MTDSSQPVALPTDERVMTDAEIQDMRAELLLIAAELLLGAVKRPKWPAHLPTYIWARVNNAWDKGDDKMKRYALRIRDIANRLPHRLGGFGGCMECDGVKHAGLTQHKSNCSQVNGKTV